MELAAQAREAVTLSEGACYRDAIAHWSSPNLAQTGFSCELGWTFGIRPSDKRLIFMLDTLDKTELFAFVPDGFGHGDYPEEPHNNDIVMKTLCQNPRGFFLDPSGGELVYLCYGYPPCKGSSCRYYRESGAEYQVPEGHHLIHLGYDNTALLGTEKDGRSSWVVANAKGELKPVKETIQSFHIRAHSSGFWALVSSGDSRGPARWNIALDGSATLDGAYPPPPPSSQYRGSCVLEGSGAAICEGDSTDVVFEDHLIRAELNKQVAEVVYSEATEPLVKSHISHLVTGP